MKIKIKDLSIKSISSCVPKDILDLNSIGISDKDNVSNKKVIDTTGISSVRISNNSTTTSDLCFKSALELLKVTGVDPKEIDGLIFVSQTGDFLMPQTSHILQDRLGLKINTICFDLPIGCNGYVYGLFQASILIQSNSCEKVLVLCGDTTTKLINEKDKSLKMVFGDGGSATLLEKGEDELSFIIYSDGERHKDLIIPSGGCRKPYKESNDELIIDKDGNSRTESDLFMDGMAIFNFAMKRVPAIIEEMLSFVSWKKDEVELYAFHQANKFMIDYLRKKVRVELDKMPVVVDGFGNTGPATIPILITETLNNDNISNYKKVILCGFGVGLSWGAVSCDLSKTKIIKTLEY